MGERCGKVRGEAAGNDRIKGYTGDYEREDEKVIADRCELSAPAVRRQARGITSVIKLDRNFHIYVHGDRQLIRKGFDDATGMHYYQLFFENET